MTSRVLNSVRTFPKYTEFPAIYPEAERRSVFRLCCDAGSMIARNPGLRHNPSTGVKK
jgi:hypothetical protein